MEDPFALPEAPAAAETVVIKLALRALVVDDGGEYEGAPASWCRGCLADMGGQRAVKLAGRWMHEACARTRLDPAYPRDAWLVIAEHLAASPKRHSTAMLRAALTALAAMARDSGNAAPAAG